MGPDDLRRVFDRPDDDSSDFDLNPGIERPPGVILRPAGVLVAVDAGHVVLTKRASHLNHHPGQVAFPGGKIEPFDAGPEAAALREAQEEIGLDPALVDVLGHLPPHETVTGFLVTPILAHLRAPFHPVPERGEVDEVFRVPLPFLLDVGNYRIETRWFRGQWRQYYVVPLGPYYIWGATARILRGLATRLSS